jgi:exodeoxyribonuclease (lambda-induced)
VIVYTDPQGADAWLEARRGVITGSRCRDARDKLKSGQPSKASTLYAMDTARERCGGRVLPTYANAAMRMGTEQEPLARAAYETETGRVAIEAGFITTDDGRFGVSVDGLVDTHGMVEIKTMVSSDTLFTAVVQRDLSAYIDQINMALWLLGRKWCDLILWAPDLEAIGRHITIIRIDRDDNAIDALESDLLAFDRVVEGYRKQLEQAA